jgi:hypothetical protein
VTVLRTSRNLGAVTSLDDDGSTPRDGGASDQDPARLTPPADPWLTVAPTSVFAEVPPAGTTPFPASAPPPPGPDRWTDERPRRHGRRWVVAVLAACALFVAGILVIDQFGDDDNGARGTTPTTTSPTPTQGAPSAAVTPSRPPVEATTTVTAGAAAPAAAPQVVYEVKASGSRNTGSVSYIDEDGEIIRLNGIPLPWRTAFPVGSQRKILVLDAQRKGGGDAGPVTCTITVGGKLLASTTAEGKYAYSLCSGSS